MKFKLLHKIEKCVIWGYFWSVIEKVGIITKTIIDYKLSRYTCYLIVQNICAGKENE